MFHCLGSGPSAYVTMCTLSESFGSLHKVTHCSSQKAYLSLLVDWGEDVIPCDALVPKLCVAFDIDANSTTPIEQAELAFLFLYVGTSIKHGNMYVPI